MTNTFRRHHKTIMWIIIVATIVGFVVYLMPAGNRLGSGGGGYSSHPVATNNGEPVSQIQYDSALREAKVFLRMNQGHWPTPQENLQILPSVADQQLFIAAKLKELNVVVPLETTASFTRKIMNNIIPGQASPKEKFDDFVKHVLVEGGNVTEDDFYHYVREQVGAELLVQLYGMDGALLTPKDAEFLFQREHISMTVEMARFPITNYTSNIVVTPEAVGQFYTNEQPNYRLHEREQVNYIPFFLTNYQAVADQILAGNSNLDTDVDNFYRSQPPEAFKDPAGNTLTPDAAKAKIKDANRTQIMAKVAYSNSLQLLQSFVDLHKKSGPVTNQFITKTELENFATSNKLAFVTTPPFDDQHPPAEFEFPAAYMQWLLQLKSAESPALSPDDFKDLPKLANRLARQSDPVSAFLWRGLSEPDQAALTNFLASPANSADFQPVQDALVKSFNQAIEDTNCIYESERFKGLTLRPESSDLLKRQPTGIVLAHLNRMLLEDAYPDQLARSPVPDPEQQYRYIQATNGFFFVGLERALPSQNQPFEVVSNQVAQDYLNRKAEALARADAEKFEAAAQVGLLKGLSFDDICATSEPKVKPQVLTPFSIDTKSIPEIDDQELFRFIVQSTFENLSVGQISRLEPLPPVTPSGVPSGRFLFYYKAQTPVSDTVMQRDLPNFLYSEREQRQMTAFSIWLNREMQQHFKKANEKDSAGEAPPSSG